MEVVETGLVPFKVRKADGLVTMMRRKQSLSMSMKQSSIQGIPVWPSAEFSNSSATQE